MQQKKRATPSPDEPPLMGLSYVPRLQQAKLTDIRSGYYQVRTYNGILKGVYHRFNKLDQRVWENNLAAAREAEKFNGTLSRKSISKIKNVVNTWNDNLYLYNLDMERKGLRKRKRMVMITLTLSVDFALPDNEIKRRLLNNFLTRCRRQYPGFMYLWRAERQKNGRLHFHIITDKYIPKKFVTNVWNDLQEQLTGQPWKNKEARNEAWPSTKVEALRDITDGLSYIVKYVTKEDNGGLIYGRLWSCSRELMDLKPLQMIVRSQAIQAMHNRGIEMIKRMDQETYFMYIITPKAYTRAEFIKQYYDVLADKPEDILAIYTAKIKEIKNNPYRGIG